MATFHVQRVRLGKDALVCAYGCNTSVQKVAPIRGFRATYPLHPLLGIHPLLTRVGRMPLGRCAPG